jgi:hypothetical protein
MTTSHLTDQEIQQYLDGLMPESGEKINHLASCTHCQVQLSLYRTVYQASSELPVMIDPMLADSVMSEIIMPIKKRTHLRAESFVFAGMIACFISIILLLAFSDVIIMRNFWSLFSSRYNGQLMALVALAGVLLVGFQWLDVKMLKKYYTRKNLI